MTLATNEQFALQAKVLAHALRKTGSRTERVCLVTKEVASHTRKGLLLYYDHLLEVEEIELCPKGTRFCLNDRPYRWAYWTKLRIWDLDDRYDRVLWMGSDMLPLYNPDVLLDCNPLPCAAADTWLYSFSEYGPVINGDLLVIQPDKIEAALLREEARRWVTAERKVRESHGEIENDEVSDVEFAQTVKGTATEFTGDPERLKRRHSEEISAQGWWLGPMDQALLNKRYRRRWTVLPTAWNFVFSAIQNPPLNALDVLSMDLGYHDSLPDLGHPVIGAQDEDLELHSVPIRILHYAGTSKPWTKDMREMVQRLEASNAFNMMRKNPSSLGNVRTLKPGWLMKLWLDMEQEVLAFEKETLATQ